MEEFYSGQSTVAVLVSILVVKAVGCALTGVALFAMHRPFMLLNYFVFPLLLWRAVDNTLASTGYGELDEDDAGGVMSRGAARSLPLTPHIVTKLNTWLDTLTFSWLNPVLKVQDQFVLFFLGLNRRSVSDTVSTGW